MKILLGIRTEIRDDTSKDRLEDAYLIYPKDNHIKIPPRIQTTLIVFLSKAIIFLLSQILQNVIFIFPLWHDYMTYEVTKLQLTPQECFISVLEREQEKNPKKPLQVGHSISQLVSSRTATSLFDEIWWMGKYLSTGRKTLIWKTIICPRLKEYVTLFFKLNTIYANHPFLLNKIKHSL